MKVLTFLVIVGTVFGKYLDGTTAAPDLIEEELLLAQGKPSSDREVVKGELLKLLLRKYEEKLDKSSESSHPDASWDRYTDNDNQPSGYWWPPRSLINSLRQAKMEQDRSRFNGEFMGEMDEPRKRYLSSLGAMPDKRYLSSLGAMPDKRYLSSLGAMPDKRYLSSLGAMPDKRYLSSLGAMPDKRYLSSLGAMPDKRYLSSLGAMPDKRYLSSLGAMPDKRYLSSLGAMPDKRYLSSLGAMPDKRYLSSLGGWPDRR